MKYQTATAFRSALETRLTRESVKLGVPLVRLRKLVSFDRFLARLMQVCPDAWLLKGGLALQIRIGERARTTQDIDVLLTLPREEVQRAITEVVHRDLDDWFIFALREALSPLPGPTLGGGHRFFITALVDRRNFESFHVDVGLGDPVVEPAERLTTPPLLAFAGIPPVTIPCYPISQHLAEKIHAYVKPRASGESTRVKDLVDMVLIAIHVPVNATALSAALQATFTAQGSGAPPTSLPAPPTTWAPKYQRLAQDVGLSDVTLPTAFAQARQFLDPVLSGQACGVWSPTAQAWL
ncbi:MAG: nucleotidyl transferase AbiEii/AbiGii toxin family protein [Chloroflexi bacterium]|nr:nucleotidyl transferase AbiEii/AbiGii toxin family protein [Chloroflexota bacterium]